MSPPNRQHTRQPMLKQSFITAIQRLRSTAVGPIIACVIVFVCGVCIQSLSQAANSPPQPTIASLLDWQASPDSDCHCQGYYREPAWVKTEPVPAPLKHSATQITAKGPVTYNTHNHHLAILHDDVRLHQTGRVVRADDAQLHIDPTNHHITQIHLHGHVVYVTDGRRIVSDQGVIDFVHQTAVFNHVVYHLNEKKLQVYIHNKKLMYDAFGAARRIDIQSPHVWVLYDTTYSTCDPIAPSWTLHIKRLTINKTKARAYGHHVLLTFYHVPLFYLPYLSFPLKKERQSGFLSPTFGYDKHRGFNVNLPLYWNIAPNVDDTLTFWFMQKRGLMFKNLFRYLTHNSVGSLYATFLANDRGYRHFKADMLSLYQDSDIPSAYLDALNHTSNNRYFISFHDQTDFNEYWHADVMLNQVSDPYYFKDFGTTAADVISNQLLNQATFRYTGHIGYLQLLLQDYETLHLVDQLDSPVENQYSRLPELDAGLFTPLPLGLQAQLDMQAVNFDYKSAFPPLTFQRPVGQRLHFRPILSRPTIENWGFFNPQLALDITSDFVSQAVPNDNEPRPSFEATRTAPIVAIDSGLHFQRTLNLHGTQYIQTLEPRLFYLYVPFVDQNEFPVFDTQLLPFSFDQLFDYNRYSGFDRIQNANQLSMGFTSQFINVSTGLPVLRWDIGIIKYFTPQRVQLSPTTPLEDDISPVVTQLTFYPNLNWTTSGGVAYDIEHHELNNAQVHVSYHDAQNRIATVGYLFVHELDGLKLDPYGFSRNTNLLNLGLSWPLGTHWRTLTSWYYNISRHRPESYFVGLQYDTCCWAIRMIVNRYYTGTLLSQPPGQRLTNQFATRYYVQLLLKGLGDYGNSQPGDLLSAALPGYNDIFQQ